MMGFRDAFHPAIHRRRRPARGFRPRFDAVESRQMLSTFTVTNTNDAGEGSLRRAIVNANADADASVITFNIPGGGVQVIRPGVPLPTIRYPVVIDGYSQPGSAPNTAETGDNAVLSIVLDGSNITDASHSVGIEIKADNSTVRGLAVSNFLGMGVLLQGSNNSLEGSFIGLDVTGKAAGPNGLGVGVFGGNAVVGGTTPAARNVISGNTVGIGIASLTLGGPALIEPAAGSVVQNNLIGTDATGTADLGNRIVGVALVGSGNVVGGTGPGEANTIAFNGTSGAGVLVAGLQKTPDATIRVVSTSNLISGNAIYANHTIGIGLLDVPMSTLMPMLSASTSDIPSAISGLVAGLNLTTSPNVHLRDAAGPNNLANYPDLSTAVTADGMTTVRGTLDSTPRTTFRIQFFANPAPDPSGYGQGQTFLGETTVTTDARGYASIVFTTTSPVPLGQSIAATAIDTANNTSEFSRAMTVMPYEVKAAPLPTNSTSPGVSNASKSTHRGATANDHKPSTIADRNKRHRVARHHVALIGMTKAVVTADRKGIAHITGDGRLAKLGKVTVSSAIDSKLQKPLLATPWLLHADLTLNTPQGQLNVRILPGTLGIDPFAQPIHLKYVASGGTGAYKNAYGEGLVDLRLTQSIPRDAAGLKAMGDQLKTTGIRFSLSFREGHLNKFGDLSSVWYKVIQTAVKNDGHAPRPRRARK